MSDVIRVLGSVNAVWQVAGSGVDPFINRPREDEIRGPIVNASDVGEVALLLVIVTGSLVARRDHLVH
jgi:hypothetical protein